MARDTLDLDRLRDWTYRRQRLGQTAPDAFTALQDVVAVYSAHPTAPLALHARTRGLTGQQFLALETERRAIRIVGMRGSAFLAPIDAADRIVAVLRQAPEEQPGALRARGLDLATYRDLKPRVLAAANEPLSPTELRQSLGAAKDDQRPYFAMRMMAREGLVIRVGRGRLRTDDLRWVATEAWLGRSIGLADPNAALEWLGHAYLRAFGPARVEDFAWWTGLPRRRVERALASIETVAVAPGMLLPADLQDEWESFRPKDHGEDVIEVLPKWDAYTMGHAPDGRARLVDDADLPRAYSTAASRVGATSGDGLPLLVEHGRAVGRWSHRLNGPWMVVTIEPFAAAARRRSELVKRAAPAFDRIGMLFEATVQVVAEG